MRALKLSFLEEQWVIMMVVRRMSFKDKCVYPVQDACAFIINNYRYTTFSKSVLQKTIERSFSNTTCLDHFTVWSLWTTTYMVVSMHSYTSPIKALFTSACAYVAHTVKKKIVKFWFYLISAQRLHSNRGNRVDLITTLNGS